MSTLLSPMPIAPGADGPIASTSTHPYSPSVKASTSVKMSDGSTFPFTFRPTSFSRYALAGGVPGMITPGFGPTQISMHPSPGFGPMSTASPGSLGTMMALDGGFSLSPTAGFHPASYKGPGSFGAAHLSNMESAFCKNFVCCGLELDDLHGLLEHFEERHCQGGDIIGVEGFEGVALSDVAEGVGVSKALGIGPGMGNVPPPGAAMGVGNGTFEGEEEWSSDGTQSGPPSPYAAQTGPATTATAGGGKPQSNLSAALQRNSSPSSTPSPPGQPTGKPAPAHAIPQRYRDALSTLSTPASSVPGSPHPNADFDEEMDSMDIDLGVGPSTAGPPPPAPSATSTVGGPGGVNDPLTALMQSFSVGGPFNVGGLSNGAASVMGGVGVPPSLLTGEPVDDSGDALTLSRQSSRSGSTASTSHPPPTGSSTTGAGGGSALGLGSTAGKKRPNHDPVTGLTPTGRQPRPWVPPSEKPFKCTVPGCDKAYKQQNGLKYHRTHGHCNQKGLTPEDEAKPFVCHHEVCGKRYKNMNGLRYHYQHSGQHGTVGIQLLSLGAHPPPQYPAGHKKSGQPMPPQPASLTSTPAGSRASSPGLRSQPATPQPPSKGTFSSNNVSPRMPQQGSFQTIGGGGGIQKPSILPNLAQHQPNPPSQLSHQMAQHPIAPNRGF